MDRPSLLCLYDMQVSFCPSRTSDSHQTSALIPRNFKSAHQIKGAIFVLPPRPGWHGCRTRMSAARSLLKVYRT
jgi:hypothetical protein